MGRISVMEIKLISHSLSAVNLMGSDIWNLVMAVDFWLAVQLVYEQTN